MDWMPEVRLDGFQPGEVAEQQGVAFCLNQDLGGFQDGESGWWVRGWAEKIKEIH